MKKPGTRLYVNCWRGGEWYIDLYVKGVLVASLLTNKSGKVWHKSKSLAKAQADRFSRALGGIPVVVAE